MPVRPIESFGQVVLLILGGVLMVIGVLWILFFVSMLLFAGLDLFAPVANGMSFQGAVILTLAMVGLLVVSVGFEVAASARRPRKADRQLP